ncbi:MAG: hypothetical protein P3X24_002160 [bacterium]|nr:hypothetical protein [bacterium]
MSLLDSATGNFWVDNGLAVLCTDYGLQEPPQDVNAVVQQIMQKLYVKTGNTGEYWDEKSGQLKTYEKYNWKEPVRLFVSIVPKTPKKEIDGKSYYTSPPPRPNPPIAPQGKRQKCDFCGREEVVLDAKLYFFPFVVNPNDFGNFYSCARRGLKMCALCALAGFAAFESWLWRRQGSTYHFFLFHTDLERLVALRQGIIELMQLQGDAKGGNFEAPFFGEYPFENLFGLLLRLFEVIRQRDSEGELDPLLAELTGAQPITSSPIVVYAISGSAGGKSFSMKALHQFDRFQPLYRLYCRWLETLQTDNSHETLKTVFRQFLHRRNRSEETLWREQICRAILQQADPLPPLEAFLYEVSASQKKPLTFGTLEVFQIYLQEVMHMDEKLLNILKGFGYELGKQAAGKKDMGLLYALRNSKNLDQFLEVLNRVQFTLGITVNPELLRVESGERIAGAPWNRAKTLLAIYAMNANLREVQPQKNEASNE